MNVPALVSMSISSRTARAPTSSMALASNAMLSAGMAALLHQQSMARVKRVEEAAEEKEKNMNPFKWVNLSIVLESKEIPVEFIGWGIKEGTTTAIILNSSTKRIMTIMPDLLKAEPYSSCYSYGE